MPAMIQATAAEVREALAGIVKANVKQCRFSVRVVVIGDRADAMRAIDVLNDNYCNCVAKPLEASDLSSDGNRHQMFVYEAAA